MRDIICTRLLDGTARCTLPHRHQHYRRSGFDIGTREAGGLELALNVLAAALPLEPGEDGVRLADASQVSVATWDLHPAFAHDVVARLPYYGGTISQRTIRDWVAAQVHRKQREVDAARFTHTRPGLANEQRGTSLPTAAETIGPHSIAVPTAGWHGSMWPRSGCLGRGMRRT